MSIAPAFINVSDLFIGAEIKSEIQQEATIIKTVSYIWEYEIP